MQIRRVGPRRYQALVTGAELRERGLAYESLDCAEESTREWLLSVLEELSAKGFTPGDRVLIEAYPAEGGGCAVFFTATGGGRRWKVRRHAILPVIYAFEDVDVLIDGAVRLFRRCSHRIMKSALYRVEGGWRLMLYPLDTPDGLSLSLMDEFARRCGEGPLAAAWLGEHGQLLLEDNAVDFLSACFG